MKKPWYKSRTIWFNLLSGLAVLMAMPKFTAVLPEEWIKWIALGTVVGNKVLRFATNSGIGATSTGDGFDNGDGAV